jgi:hypothetical protein
MLPASYQLPAAVILVLGGALACFLGYRMFRVVLAIFGFILGALMASSLVGPSETTPMLVAAVVGGVIGAIILNLAYFIGVALVGAGIGAFVLHVIWARVASGDPHVAVVIVAAVIGAVAATSLQRIVIIVGTAFGGAWTLMVGALALMGDKAARAATAAGDVWVVYPMHPAPGRTWVIWTWLALAVLGLAVQFKTGPARKKGPVKTKLRKKSA